VFLALVRGAAQGAAADGSRQQFHRLSSNNAVVKTPAGVASTNRIRN
jgi:hypothetical protein